MTKTFEELKQTYEGPLEMFVEITIKADAEKQIDSTCSDCWNAGAKFGDTGWIKLASPSAYHRGDRRTVSVCKASLLEGGNE